MRSKNGVWVSETGAGWEIVRRGVFDYGDYLEESPIEIKKQPKQLVVNMILPLVTKASEIDIEVYSKHLRVRAGPHDFEVKLPYEVLTNTDLNAKWVMPNLSIELDVKPLKLEKRHFRDFQSKKNEEEQEHHQEFGLVHEIETSPTEGEPVVDDGANNEKLISSKSNEIRQAKYSISIEDRVATVVLFVPRSVESTLEIADNRITVEDKKGQKYEALVNSPFPLSAMPVIQSTPVSMTLVFIEQEQEQEQEPEPVEEVSRTVEEPVEEENVSLQLQNRFIFELE